MVAGRIKKDFFKQTVMDVMDVATHFKFDGMRRPPNAQQG
jgi:hypothetical protein